MIFPKSGRFRAALVEKVEDREKSEVLPIVCSKAFEPVKRNNNGKRHQVFKPLQPEELHIDSLSTLGAFKSEISPRIVTWQRMQVDATDKSFKRPSSPENDQKRSAYFSRNRKLRGANNQLETVAPDFSQFLLRLNSEDNAAMSSPTNQSRATTKIPKAVKSPEISVSPGLGIEGSTLAFVKQKKNDVDVKDEPLTTSAVEMKTSIDGSFSPIDLQADSQLKDHIVIDIQMPEFGERLGNDLIVLQSHLTYYENSLQQRSLLPKMQQKEIDEHHKDITSFMEVKELSKKTANDVSYAVLTRLFPNGQIGD